MQNIEIAHIKIEGLYLKLNNKLILDVEKIDLSEFDNGNDSEMSTQDVVSSIQRALRAISFFEHVHIEQILLQDGDIGNIMYDNDIYSLRLKYVDARFGIQNDN